MTDRRKLTKANVFKLLSHEKVIESALIEETIKLIDFAPSLNTNISKRITFNNCLITKLDAMDCGFEKPFIMEHCIVKAAFFEPSYFLDDAKFSDCEFLNDVGFLSMGDTWPDTTFVVTNCLFHGFVNMFDAYFKGRVEFSQCSFLKGTNMLGNNGQPYATRFDVAPILHNNIGKLDVDDDRIYINMTRADLEEHFQHK